MISAARGSVARASAFSASVSVSVRNVRISSFSSPSKRLIVLSGASWGWSCRMIGDDSSRSDRSGGPASTGQVCSDVQPSTNGWAHRGGSVAETHAPASAASTVCAAISDVRSTSSRGAPGGHTPSLITSRRSRCTR